MIGRTAPVTLSMLIGLSAFVLLIACSNLANLFLARTMARAREFAVRSALGACVRDISRLVLAPGAKLALIGSALGLLCALGVSHLLAATNPGMQLNSSPVLVGTTLLLIAVALVACWLPARRAARINPIEALRA